MKEFKIIFMSQIATILFLGGLILGITITEPIMFYIVKEVKIPPKQFFPKEIIQRAMISHGTYAASKEECGDWIYINKEGVPCKLFRDVK
jgi:hypothetical protein